MQIMSPVDEALHPDFLFHSLKNFFCVAFFVQKCEFLIKNLHNFMNFNVLQLPETNRSKFYKINYKIRLQMWFCA